MIEAEQFEKVECNRCASEGFRPIKPMSHVAPIGWTLIEVCAPDGEVRFVLCPTCAERVRGVLCETL